MVWKGGDRVGLVVGLEGGKGSNLGVFFAWLCFSGVGLR